MSTYTTDVKDDFEEQSEITVKEAAGDCEVIETSDKWEGPFPEYDKYGTLTGSSYVRCQDCGREILSGRKDFASHRGGCAYGDE
ncbi:hypothetical protein [Haloterrigena salifodinae]|uniref:hypothetical protein n=1 Tax=Haloterrigena salifodinae TaxID=2675099 RepID=UPI001B87048C|nr:hypothetical protein [Haloterrigena salifodinae]